MPGTDGVPAQGDRIEIPKGTTVYDRGVLNDQATLTARKAVGTVETVRNLAEGHGWQRFVSDAENRILRETALRIGAACRYPWRDAWHDGIAEFDAVRNRIMSMHGGDLRFVEWGGRMAHVSEVLIVDAKPVRERAVTLRTRMTPGSTWRTTKDLRLTGWVSTYDMERRAFALLPPIETDPETLLSRIPLMDLPAGTEFTVRPRSRHKALGRGNGLAAPVTAPIDDFVWHVENPKDFFQNPFVWNGLHLPINQIEGSIEQVEEGDSRVFVLKDRDLGLFFAGFTYDHDSNEHLPKMVETFGSARKYGSPANAKASILAFTGMIPEGGDRPEWVGWERKIDLPIGWELIEVDRITLEESPSEDIQSWRSSIIANRRP